MIPESRAIQRPPEAKLLAVDAAGRMRRILRANFVTLLRRIWAHLASYGRPIQYAHVPAPLALWDVWTPIAGPPVAFESPSAGFTLDWRSLALMRSCGICDLDSCRRHILDWRSGARQSAPVRRAVFDPGEDRSGGQRDACPRRPCRRYRHNRRARSRSRRRP